MAQFEINVRFRNGGLFTANTEREAEIEAQRALASGEYELESDCLSDCDEDEEDDSWVEEEEDEEEEEEKDDSEDC